ncbi:hypothetical protein ACFQZT_22035 [Paenibacillus sp. GCM10027628]|uniref:hypothetical protein n=1 Tax=Paenibacillus sp. GCM10027628 TaxID=3273413 RepID=UPI0036250CD2
MLMNEKAGVLNGFFRFNSEAGAMLFIITDVKVKWKRVNSDVSHRYRVEDGIMVSQSEAIAMFFNVADVRENGIEPHNDVFHRY